MHEKYEKRLEANKDGKATKSTPKSEPKKSNVFTKHYKTGKELGVMTRSQRRKYDEEAAGRTFEGEVAKYEKSSGHGKSHKRETLYKASLRPGSKTYKAEQAKKQANKGSGRKGSPGKGTYGKSLPSNPQLKTQTTKDNRDPNRHSLKVTNEKNTGPTKLIKGPDGKVRRVKA